VLNTNSIKGKANHTETVWDKMKDVVTSKPGRIYKIKSYKQDIPVGPATLCGFVTSETS
jgi:hypothetical protein